MPRLSVCDAGRALGGDPASARRSSSAAGAACARHTSSYTFPFNSRVTCSTIEHAGSVRQTSTPMSEEGIAMQFHHHGYVSGDPRVQPAAGVGLDRPEELPDEVDVLIVGTGPAGMIAAAQLSQFPDVTTRIVERRARPARDRPGRRHPGAQRRDLPGVRLRRADHRGGVPDHRDELLAAGPRRPVADRPRGPADRRPARHQRVPAPHRQPGPRARLLRRVHGQLARPG